MGNFFQELAKKLAERWVGLLLIPGALFAVTTALGIRLGHRHALDWTMALNYVSATTSMLAKQPGGMQAAVIVALLLTASSAGLVVQATASMTRALWLGRWPWPFRRIARWRTCRRQTRWQALVDRRTALAGAPQDEIDRAAERVTNLAMAKPGRPTWMGDRVHAVEQIALDRYGIDASYGWSRLWLVLPEVVRTDLMAANGAFAAAVAVGSWAWLFLVLGSFWFPAMIIALIVGLTGWVRAREAISDLATLSEAAIDLHGRTLATALGVGEADAKGPLEAVEGAEVTAIVRKGR